jgi:hypothetical protein
MQYPEGHSNSVDQVGLSAPQFSQQPPTSLHDELKTKQLQQFFAPPVPIAKPTQSSEPHHPSLLGSVPKQSHTASRLPRVRMAFKSSLVWKLWIQLTSQVVTEMKQQHKKNYPAEVLLPETTPSLRLLSLVHHQKLKAEFKMGTMEVSS